MLQSVRPHRISKAGWNMTISIAPAEQREALVLIGSEGFAYIEAAAMCNVPIGTIKSRWPAHAANSRGCSISTRSCRRSAELG